MNDLHFLTRLFCLLNTIYASTLCSWHSPVQKTNNPQTFFKKAGFKKEWAIPHEKCPFLLDIDFLVKGIKNLTLKFYMKKALFLICRMIQRMLSFGGCMTDFGVTGISRCFGGLV
jgi:hypothetical protein